MQGTVQELTQTNRYQLSAMVLFSLRQPDGSLLQLTGVTRDISMRGVSLLTAATVEVGAHLKLDVYLPSLHTRARKMKLHGEGTVVRVEPLGIEKGVAAEVLFEKEPEATLLDASVIQ